MWAYKNAQGKKQVSRTDSAGSQPADQILRKRSIGNTAFQRIDYYYAMLPVRFQVSLRKFKVFFGGFDGVDGRVPIRVCAQRDEARQNTDMREDEISMEVWKTPEICCIISMQ